MVSWIFIITWAIMFLIGMGSTFILLSGYFSYTQNKFAKLKALPLSIVWFISLPTVGGYLLWTKRQQIQMILDQVNALQQMQLAFNQLSLVADSEGDDVDSAYA